MLAVLVSACLAQQFGLAQVVEPLNRTGVAVQVASGRVGVGAFDGGFLVAWADDRRLLNLARTPITAGADVWVRFVPTNPRLGGLFRPRVVCPRAGVTAGPRLAMSRAAGAAGLAWVDDQGVSLATLQASGGWLDGPCGQLVSPNPTNLVEVAPRGPGFAVLFNGVSSVLQSNVVGSALMPPIPRVPGQQSVVVAVSGASNATVVGWLASQDLLVDFESASPMTTEPGVDAFDLVEGTAGPAVALVRDGGLFLGATPTTASLEATAVMSRRPYAVAIDGGILALVTDQQGNSRLVSSAPLLTSSNMTTGLPEGLAVTAGAGLALVTHTSGVLGAVDVQLSAPGFQPGVSVISVAGVLQRRPSLAWNTEKQAFELVWEEATSVTSYVSRHASIVDGVGRVSGSELFIDGGWPRVFPQFDGGLGYMTLDGLVTAFSLPRGAVTEAVDQIGAPLQGVVAAPGGGFGWAAPSASPSGRHQEFTLRSMQQPHVAFLPDEVTCATWFEGSYVVARRADGGASIATFGDDSPPLPGQPVTASRACVASRLTRPRALGIALADSAGLRVGTVDGGLRRLPFDAGVRDLQLASVADHWLVVWDTEDALRAALVSESEGVRPLLAIDERPQSHRGVPSLATSPTGLAAVAWPVLEGDSVELRVRVLSLTSITPVIDAGVVDGGGVLVDAGVNDDGGVQADGGVGVDGGVPDDAVRFVPVCGCASVSDALWWLVALVVARRRRGPVMQ